MYIKVECGVGLYIFENGITLRRINSISNCFLFTFTRISDLMVKNHIPCMTISGVCTRLMSVIFSNSSRFVHTQL